MIAPQMTTVADADQFSIKIYATRAVRRAMAFRLTMWAGGSWLLGLALWLTCTWLDAGATRSFAEAFAAELVVWGLLCAGCGMALLSQAQRADRVRTPDRATIDRELAARDRLLRVLRFSSKLLVVLFLPAGVVLLVIGLLRNAPPSIGHGAGVILQSTFLALFDRAFIAALSKTAG